MHVRTHEASHRTCSHATAQHDLLARLSAHFILWEVRIDSWQEAITHFIATAAQMSHFKEYRSSFPLSLLYRHVFRLEAERRSAQQRRENNP